MSENDYIEINPSNSLEGLGKYKKIYENTFLVWEKMKSEATENGLWSGSISALKDELGITYATMSKVMSVLEIGGTKKLSQGNRFNETTILLGSDPTIDHVRSGIATTTRGSLKNTTLSIEAINNRIDDVESSISAMNSLIMSTTATINQVLNRLSQITVMLASGDDEYKEYDEYE